MSDPVTDGRTPDEPVVDLLAALRDSLKTYFVVCVCPDERHTSLGLKSARPYTTCDDEGLF